MNSAKRNTNYTNTMAILITPLIPACKDSLELLPSKLSFQTAPGEFSKQSVADFDSHNIQLK